MRLILSYMKRYKGLVALNFVAILSFAMVELGIPTLVAQIIDVGVARGDQGYILRMGAVLVTVSVLGGLGSVLLAYCASKISICITRDIQRDVFVKAETFSHAEYNSFGVPSLITRTTNDAFQLLLFINMLLRTAFLTPVMIIVSFTLILRTSAALSGVIAFTVPFIIAGVVIIALKAEPLSVRQQKLMDALNRISRENLTGIRVIRAFRRDAYEQRRFESTNEDYAHTARRVFRLMSVTQPAFFLLLNLAVVAIFWLSSGMIDTGSLQVGQLVAFLDYMFHAMFSLALLSLVFVMYPRAAVSAGRIREVLTARSDIRAPEHPAPIPEQRGTLRFEHVTFCYPDGEENVLHDVSFSAGPGETVAFIGSTGSGKSTLINLIPRFYDVTAGRILVDGVDVRDYDPADLRRKIGFVSQKALLFNGTIAENIRFGREDASDEAVRHAADVAQALEFILDKPGGFDAMITEAGANLSGGQKQRLSIARAVVRQPEFYIFDDSFSALDFRTDAALRARLDQETGSSVVLIVAQRVSSIMDADQIIVLNEGRVVGMGRHRQLLDSCEIYREIAASQMTEEEMKR